ncbi:hypothetical protein CGRA01v4_02096 [Colletotrichum graminicola]|nr:hypothetical protein CGRA01v4_02096 [Colletotrichum graminicola]
MAERSKALASGASQVIGVGSNPTLVSFCFASFVAILISFFCSVDGSDVWQ